MSNEKILDCNPDDMWPIGKKAAFLTAIIGFGLGTFDFIHRQILASVLPFIREEWALTDAQSGMLISIVNIALSIMLIPSAYFIDRWSRKKVLTIMSTIWSLATGAGALATSYIQLLFCRFFLGAGEAAYNPAAVPLLAASFPKKYRSTAISVTQLGTTLGVPLGTIFGAYAATHFGWRNAFIIAMIPGLILAFLTIFIKDYKTPQDEKSKQPYFLVIKEIIQVPSMRFLTLGAICFYFFQGMQMNWLPSYFVRVGNIPITEASLYASSIFMVSILSTALSGPVIDIVKRHYNNAASLIITIGLLSGFVCFVIGYIFSEPSSTTQLAFLILGNACSSFLCAGIYSCIMPVVHPGMHATAISIVTFSQNILGFALGPLVTGILSDYVGLGTAMQIMVIVIAISGLSFLCCTFTFNKDSEKIGCQDVSFE